MDPWQVWNESTQYMALGVPTVCSPVGVNPRIIRNSENGFLAETDDQWESHLTRLLHSPELRQRLGMAGRATIEAGYSLSLHAPTMYQIFKSVLGYPKTERKTIRLTPVSSSTSGEFNH